MQAVCVTGVAGLCGFHLCCRLLENGWAVTESDSLNDYYDVKLKRDLLQLLDSTKQFNHGDLKRDFTLIDDIIDGCDLEIRGVSAVHPAQW